MLNATGCSRDGLVWVQILYDRRWSSQCAPHSRALVGSTVREYLISFRIWNVVKSEGWRRTRFATDIARISMSAHIHTRTRKHTLTFNIDCRTDSPHPNALLHSPTRQRRGNFSSFSGSSALRTTSTNSETVVTNENHLPRLCQPIIFMILTKF